MRISEYHLIEIIRDVLKESELCIKDSDGSFEKDWTEEEIDSVIFDIIIKAREIDGKTLDF